MASVSPLERSTVPWTTSRAAYDALAADYDGTFTRPLDRAENVVTRRMLLEALPDLRAGPVLDLGCGTGLLLELVDLAPDRYVGIDISPKMVALARRKFPDHHFLVADMQHLPIKPTAHLSDKWDRILLKFGILPVQSRGVFASVICLFGSMSYAMQSGHVMRQLYELLRPGGSFFLMLLGERYRARKTHIVDAHGMKVPFWTATDVSLRRLARSATWYNVTQRGLHAATDRLPSATPTWLLTAALEIERQTIGRYHPDQCYYQILSGQKPGGA